MNLSILIVDLITLIGVLVAWSFVFGIWHIRPTLQALRVNGLAQDRPRAVVRTCAAVATARDFGRYVPIAIAGVDVPVSAA